MATDDDDDMNNTQMLAALMALPTPDALHAGKIDDPLGSDTSYRARTVVKLIQQAVKAEREACAALCEQEVTFRAGHGSQFEGYGQVKKPRGGRECAAAIRRRGL